MCILCVLHWVMLCAILHIAAEVGLGRGLNVGLYCLSCYATLRMQLQTLQCGWRTPPGQFQTLRIPVKCPFTFSGLLRCDVDYVLDLRSWNLRLSDWARRLLEGSGLSTASWAPSSMSGALGTANHCDCYAWIRKLNGTTEDLRSISFVYYTKGLLCRSKDLRGETVRMDDLCSGLEQKNVR
ncbi:uncharacterized protein BDV17DRAFT_58729 [Aspergillus undulatus]|uniref:uncharacterized protein n=1 Tax=Aspergillus undulatus TaxID=1810928 RepID=UPI003CCCC06A